MTARGDAYRNPIDSNQPLVGEEIAAARALIDLGSQLLQAAAAQMSRSLTNPLIWSAEASRGPSALLFDRRSDRALRAVWDRLEGRAGPHISGAVQRTGDPVELSFDGFGCFPSGLVHADWLGRRFRRCRR